MKIVTVVGARPQFIKASVVSRALRASGDATEVLVHTGQHYDDCMSDVFFRELGMTRPDYALGVGSGSHGSQTGKMLSLIEEVLLKETPDWLLVYGDTNSTLAGALAAVKLHVKVAHVEAGLRSFNRAMPEEINRILTDHASNLLFAPTVTAVSNLRTEGIAGSMVRLVGDVMYDAAVLFGRQSEGKVPALLKSMHIPSKGYILATIHRAENTDHLERLGAIFEGLIEVAREIPVVLPLHPRTRKALQGASLLSEVEEKLRVIEPVGYLDMVALEKGAGLVVTDSGGVQKEAFFHKVPCVTLRGETEWIELVELGWNHLADPCSVTAVVNEIRCRFGSQGHHDASLYGGGGAATLIVQALLENGR